MAKPLLISSDVHGCHLTLQALLAKARAQLGDFDLYLLGDLIDRGPRSMELVQWVRRNRVPCVKANHDDMMVDFYRRMPAYGPKAYQSRYGIGIWEANGGKTTIRSMDGKPPSKALIDWMARLPLSITPPGYPELLLSHTGHVKAQHEGHIFSEIPAIWRRDQGFPKDGMYRVFGHTSVEKAVVTETYAAIDTGCAYGGFLSGLVWPTREIITLKSIDS